MSNDPRHVRRGDLPTYLFGGVHRFRFLATGEQTGGSYGLTEVVSPAGTGPGPHRHEHSEEHFVVLEGEVVFAVDGRSFTALPGDLVHVPRQAEHQFTVVTDATMLATFTPAGDEQALLDACVPLDAPDPEAPRPPLP